MKRPAWKARRLCYTPQPPQRRNCCTGNSGSPELRKTFVEAQNSDLSASQSGILVSAPASPDALRSAIESEDSLKAFCLPFDTQGGAKSIFCLSNIFN
jgi:hypothetical protein